MDAATWMIYKGSFRKRAFALLAALATAWVAITPSTYKIHTNAVVKAERERVIAAPIAAPVAAVFVRAGDRVEAGTTLARMDTAALELEAREIEADIAATDARLHTATSEGDTAAASIASAERRAHAARLAGVQQRIADATITAPVAGTVIGSELAESEGRVVPVGHQLLSIAEAGSMTLEVHVPEGRVADLQAGMGIRFASHARPESPAITDLERVAPAAAERKGAQVFIAEAGLAHDASIDWLRPGMEGVAIIDAGERPNWWIATHRLVDAARLRFWID